MEEPGPLGQLAYTANDKDTMTITVAALTAQIDEDTKVWQDATIGVPSRYSIYDGEIGLDTVLGDTYGGISLKIKHLKSLTALTCFQQNVEMDSLKC